jgi:hypothetical protein
VSFIFDADAHKQQGKGGEGVSGVQSGLCDRCRGEGSAVWWVRNQEEGAHISLGICVLSYAKANHQSAQYFSVKPFTPFHRLKSFCRRHYKQTGKYTCLSIEVCLHSFSLTHLLNGISEFHAYRRRLVMFE